MNVKNIAKALQNKEQVIREVVYDSSLKDNGVLYGSRAFNVQVPPRLRKKTSDYDVFVKNPKKTAKKIASTLKRRLEGDIKVVKGSNPGTYRVKLDDEAIVDLTQKRGKIKTKNVYGLKVKDLSTIKRGTQRLVKKKGAEYRREKDLDTLERIKKVEKIFQEF